MIVKAIQFLCGAICVFFGARQLYFVARHFLWDILDLLVALFLLFAVLLGVIMMAASVAGVL